jgi:hypothetical protein
VPFCSSQSHHQKNPYMTIMYIKPLLPPSISKFFLLFLHYFCVVFFYNLNMSQLFTKKLLISYQKNI